MAQFNFNLLINILKCVRLIIDGVLNVVEPKQTVELMHNDNL